MGIKITIKIKNYSFKSTNIKPINLKNRALSWFSNRFTSSNDGLMTKAKRIFLKLKKVFLKIDLCMFQN